MATFEQALDTAFEITFLHGQEVDAARTSTALMEDEQMADLLMASAEQTFIGSLDILGTMLHMAGRIQVFAHSSSHRPGDWADGSRDALLAMMEWARENKKITEAEYAGWMAVQNHGVPASDIKH